MTAERVISSALSQTGSTWISLENLKAYLVQHKISIDFINAAIVANKVIHYVDEKKRSWLTTSYYNQLEDDIAQNIMRILYCNSSTTYEESRIRAIVHEFEQCENDGRHLHKHQIEAVIMVVNNGFSVLTGGPGTGKTTVLSAITYVLRHIEPNVKIVFTAPTGKAARRISESTGEPALTLHKKLHLGYDESKEGVTFLEDILFVDESSMNDTYLTATLLRAVAKNRKVVFVGDVDQLPSVGAGAVLRDIILSGCVPVTHLTHTFRQDNSSTLYENICNIRNGLAEFKSGKDFNPICLDTSVSEKEIENIILNIYKKELAKYDCEDTIVLIPYRRKGICSNAINAKLQLLANPKRYGYRHHNKKDDHTLFFMENDLVMQLENRNECSNGDVGRIRSVTPNGITVSYIDGTVHYGLNELDQLALAYATTIHKSQGSEYKSVIMVLLNCHETMLSRNLLYTGVTRAKEKCTVIYQQKALEMAIATIAEASRITMLKEKLRTMRCQYTAVYGF